MGDNAEIYQRLGMIEQSLSALTERVHWLERLMLPIFLGGGVVGSAVTIIIERVAR